MRKFYPTNIIFVALLCLCFTLTASSSALACGKERWAVKVAQDKHVKWFYKDQKVESGILVNPVNTTVAKLYQEPYPFEKLTGFPPQWSYTQRAGQAEFRIWKITAFLLKKKNEDDEDYHLVLKSGNNTMIAEIPSENCVQDTPEPLKGMINQAREDFDNWYQQQPNKNSLNQKVVITGLGFFDRVHGGTGESKINAIELHPVISIKFVD
jgi:hypothetical protein